MACIDSPSVYFYMDEKKYMIQIEKFNKWYYKNKMSVHHRINLKTAYPLSYISHGNTFFQYLHRMNMNFCAAPSQLDGWWKNINIFLPTLTEKEKMHFRDENGISSTIID